MSTWIKKDGKFVKTAGAQRLWVGTEAELNDALKAKVIENNTAAIVVCAASLSFDMLVPVGYIYEQLPGMPDPYQLYAKNGTQIWELLEYNGAFFRAEGGLAAAFQGPEAEDALVPQAHALQSHTHTHISSNGTASGNGATGNSTMWMTYSNPNTWNLIVPGFEDDDYDKRIGVETRPDNMTTRVWKRVA